MKSREVFLYLYFYIEEKPMETTISDEGNALLGSEFLATRFRKAMGNTQTGKGFGICASLIATLSIAFVCLQPLEFIHHN